MMVRTSLTNMNDWKYKGETFTVDQAQELIDAGAIGFVYEITDIKDGKKYIGKKLLSSVRKLPPLKGQKKKRVKRAQSDWLTYHGSSTSVCTILSERPNDLFREILVICYAKGELSYMEAKIQFEREVLLSDDYHNGIISCRINKTHVKNLWKK